jgi:hypothetical protein
MGTLLDRAVACYWRVGTDVRGRPSRPLLVMAPTQAAFPVGCVAAIIRAPSIRIARRLRERQPLQGRYKSDRRAKS